MAFQILIANISVEQSTPDADNKLQNPSGPSEIKLHIRSFPPTLLLKLYSRRTNVYPQVDGHLRLG